MNGLQKKNAKNLHFWAFWAKMANFGKFLAKMDKMGFFFKKALGKFFSHLQALTNCKVSGKSNERFSSNSVTHVRTDARTDGRESLGLQRLRRETKNFTFLHSLRLAFLQKIREIQYAVFEKMRKTLDFGHFWPFWLKFWTDAAQNDQF